VLIFKSYGKYHILCLNQNLKIADSTTRNNEKKQAIPGPAFFLVELKIFYFFDLLIRFRNSSASFCAWAICCGVISELNV